MAASRARRRLPISLFFPQLRDHIRNLDRSARRFSAAIDFIFEAPLARLDFVVEAEDGIDDGNSVSDRDSLQSIGDRSAQIFRVISFAFQDDADSDDGVAAFFQS